MKMRENFHKKDYEKRKKKKKNKTGLHKGGRKRKL